MADLTSLPRQNSDIVLGDRVSVPWYNFFRRLVDRVGALENAPPIVGGGTVSTPNIERTIVDTTTARTLSSDDSNCVIEFTNAGAITVTVPSNTLLDECNVYLTQGGAGQVTVVAGAGVTIDYSDSLKTRTQESMIGLKQIQVNKFELFGDAEPVAPAKSALIRSANSVGVPAFVAPTADSQKLKQSGGVLVFATDTASEIVNVPAGNITATNVQTALNELDTEKLSITSDALNLKRAPSVQAVVSNATVTAVAADDLVVITAQAVGLTLANPTGTFAQGQKLTYRIKDNGTAQTIAFGANFRALSITLPAITVLSKTLYIYCEYNSTDTKFDVVRLAQEA